MFALLFLSVLTAGAAGTKMYNLGNWNMCLDVVDGNFANGAPVQIWSCTDGPNQQWHADHGDVYPVGGVPIYIYSPSGTKFCLDVYKWDDAAPTKISECNGGENQLWFQSMEPGYKINLVNTDYSNTQGSKKCLAVSNPNHVSANDYSNGMRLELWPCDYGADDQSWYTYDLSMSHDRTAVPSSATVAVRGKGFIPPTSPVAVLNSTQLVASGASSCSNDWCSLPGVAKDQGSRLGAESVGTDVTKCEEFCQSVTGCCSFSWSPTYYNGQCLLYDNCQSSHAPTASSYDYHTYIKFSALSGVAKDQGNQLAYQPNMGKGADASQCEELCLSVDNCSSFSWSPTYYNGACTIFDKTQSASTPTWSDYDYRTYYIGTQSRNFLPGNAKSVRGEGAKLSGAHILV